MMRRINLQPAYVLHSRLYQETSLLLELFTLEFGRIAVVAKGVRRPKSAGRALLQAFTPLLISCAGKGELLCLNHYERATTYIPLFGKRLISGFYLNELLMRLLHRFDPHEDLFNIYSKSLQKLTGEEDEEQVLRCFEKALLKTIGYELPLQVEYEGGTPIKEGDFYLFEPDRGAALVTKSQMDRQGVCPQRQKVYSGKSLIALHNETLEDPKIKREVKSLMRQALKHRLGHKPLETRKLFC